MHGQVTEGAVDVYDVETYFDSLAGGVCKPALKLVDVITVKSSWIDDAIWRVVERDWGGPSALSKPLPLESHKARRSVTIFVPCAKMVFVESAGSA